MYSPDILRTFSLLGASIWRIHLLACPCGSTMSGHLRAANIVIAFSTEKSSVGRPSMFHCRILTASPNVLIRVGFSLEGIASDLHVSIQVLICLCRNVEVNGPK